MLKTFLKKCAEFLGIQATLNNRGHIVVMLYENFLNCWKPKPISGKVISRKASYTEVGGEDYNGRSVERDTRY